LDDAEDRLLMLLISPAFVIGKKYSFFHQRVNPARVGAGTKSCFTNWTGMQ